MLKAVIDTNVWISALLGTGAPKKLKDCVEQKQFEPVYATELVDELVEVLARPKFAKKITDIDAVDLVRLIRKNAILLRLEQVAAISRDPKDDIFLACAAASGADFIVSGDEDLLSVNEYHGTKIVTPSEFLQILLIA